ncbi:hypothetical protein C3K47_04575 [Solitalea longa]|uniref:Uncharacterized protein n=1 Tax=Solitalea longa TaxID=2079460 RepID=A0A2S5A652_9SPHI|nr:hypothetical protein [Solitalea longa]POY37812.1 hypothetical protein C3K47_04575 [Solitalea longa]
MENFKIREGGFKEIRNALLIKAIPISLLAASAGLAISHFNSNGQPDDVNVLPYVIPMMLAAMAFGLYRGVNRQKVIFDSYKLSVDDLSIVREQHNTPTITIDNNELTEIIKKSDGGFVIKGNSAVNVIAVPAQINEIEKLEKLLAEKKPISTQSNESFLQKYNRILSLFTIGLMVIVYTDKDKIVVGICGTVLLMLLGYSFYETQRSKNIDNKTKKGMWWLILVTASIIGVMYFKLTT